MQLNIDKIPKDLDEAVQMVIEGMEPGDKQALLGDNPLMHMSFGMWLRNNWNLWGVLNDENPPSRIALWFKDKGIVHADDMTGILFEAISAKLKNQAYNLEERIKHFRNYWIKIGIDPDTGKEFQG